MSRLSPFDEEERRSKDKRACATHMLFTKVVPLDVCLNKSRLINHLWESTVQFDLELNINSRSDTVESL